MSVKPIVLIGPYPASKLQHIGGTTILFKNFVDFLKSRKIAFSYISIIRWQGFSSKYLNYFYVLFNSFFRIPNSSLVFFNFNRRGLLYLAPVLLIYSKLWGIKTALRLFGAENKEQLKNRNFILKAAARFVVAKVDFLFLETKYEQEYFLRYNKNTFWFPNCRSYPSEFIPRKYNKKFVFISQLRISKGVLLLLDVFRKLDNSYSLEIYGPVVDEELRYITELELYKGVLLFDQVYKVLKNHDILLLPTFHEGEGYPGIILEAYTMSVPVITTHWKSIPEIVQEGKSGLMIPANSTIALKESILSITNELYGKLNIGAYEMSKNFQSEEIHARIISIVTEPFKTSN